MLGLLVKDLRLIHDTVPVEVPPKIFKVLLPQTFCFPIGELGDALYQSEGLHESWCDGYSNNTISILGSSMSVALHLKA